MNNEIKTNNIYNDFAFYYDVLTQNISYSARGKYFHSLIIENSNFSEPILLDLGCGTGSLTYVMEDLGYNVIGTDNSTSMLTIAMEKKIDKNSEALFLCQEMTKLNLFGTIDVCISALDTLNHILSEFDLLKIFEKVHLFLNQGGVFIFDMNTLYKHRFVLSNNSFVIEDEDVYCVWQNTLLDDDIINIHLDLFAYDNNTGLYDRLEENFYEAAYSIDTIQKIITKSGFMTVAIYDDDSKNNYHEQSQRAVFVIKKQ